MTMTIRQAGQILLFLSGLLLVACRPTPILIYVTPTPQTEIDITTTPVPTVAVEATEATAELTEEAGAAATSTRRATAVVGSVIGPDYTPPPTNTPLPTNTPPPTETRTPRRGTTTPDAPSEEAPAAPTAAATSPVRSQDLPDLDGSLIGLQVHAMLDQEAWDQAVGDIERLEIGWAKVQIDWSLLQPNNAQEISQDFRRQELYLESLNQRGLKVLISVAKAPGWARTTTAEAGPPDDPQALADFITLMLREFGESVDAVEVWNEPNLLREWQGQPLTGASYMRYFAPAYEAIRAYSPEVVVVTGAPAPTSNGESSVDDRDYLRQMYASGLGSYSDVAIGVHPYGWGNAPDARCCDASDERGWDDDPHFFFMDTIAEYREIMVANGHENNELWPTEFGWATWDGLPGSAPETWMTYNDRWQQGQYALRAFQIGQETDYIGPMFLWNLNFAMLPSLLENRDERAAYGLIVPLQPRERPAYWMLYDAVRPDVQLERYD